MSSIGSGPGIGTGPIELSGVRAVSSAESRPVAVDTPAAKAPPAATGGDQAAAMVTTNAFSAGQAPVDGERVSQIRKAIQSGSYPMIPAKISDAMIAAGIMLQVER